jgi:biopolymer transport protein ExbB/biopolymer transport protein TolQ
MFFASIANAASNVHAAAAWLFQEAAVGWDVVSMWHNMGVLAKIVVIVLGFMSVISVAVFVDRVVTYSKAKSQSRAFAPAVAKELKDGRIEGAIKVAEKFNKSHLAQVVAAGLQEFKSHDELTPETVEAAQRALDRAQAIVHAQLKRGLGALATIGSTAPFVGLFGTVVGILNAFKSISTNKTTGLGAVAGGISEALVTTAFGLLVAIPAVWFFNYLTGRSETFDVEANNSSSELVDYFLKQRKAK